MSKITEEEFNKRLDKLAEENWKVKSLLKTHGSFDNIPKFLQEKIIDLIAG